MSVGALSPKGTNVSSPGCNPGLAATESFDPEGVEPLHVVNPHLTTSNDHLTTHLTTCDPRSDQ
jgi:hypothetical protein